MQRRGSGHLPVFNLVLTQDADELSAETTLGRAGRALHKEHNGPALVTTMSAKRASPCQLPPRFYHEHLRCLHELAQPLIQLLS